MPEFSHTLGTLEPWIQQYGVVTIFVILTLESVGLPLPGESLLIVAAITASRGEISFPALLFSAWAGAVTGDNIGYWIGRRLGHDILSRIGGKFGLTAEHLRKVEAAFTRYGPVTVLFARFVNILRQLNGIVAGTLVMDWRRFLVLNALGGALWVMVWTTAGYYLGAHQSDIIAFAHKLGFFGAAAFSIALAVVFITIFLRRKHVRSGATRKTED